MDLVRSNDKVLKNLFLDRLTGAVLRANLTFLRYTPWMPPVRPKRLDDLINEVIAKRRAVPFEKAKKDLLQIFIEANQENPLLFSDDIIKSEIETFMIAGSDTTSFTATAALLLLLNNTEKLKNLISELDTAFPSINGPIDFDTLQGLPYLNAVINEAMRLYPVATCEGCCQVRRYYHANSQS